MSRLPRRTVRFRGRDPEGGVECEAVDVPERWAGTPGTERSREFRYAALWVKATVNQPTPP